MKEFTRSCSHILNNMLCTSSLVVQFSKINAAHFVPQPVRCSTVPCCAVSLRQPIYYTTFFSVCQGVFQKFFEDFFRSFILTFDSTPRLPKKRYLFAPSFWALDYYITFLSVCQGVFQKFFRIFSHPFFGSLSCFRSDWIFLECSFRVPA